MALGGETKSGQLGFIPQFGKKDGAEGCQKYFEIHV
jgi:hypothetical protein